MLILPILFSFQIIGVSRGNTYVFDSAKDYLLKNGKFEILLEKPFYNAYDACFDPLWLYVLGPEGLYTVNPMNGKIVSFLPLKRTFYNFGKDTGGNFYLLNRTTGEIKVINFSKQDSFHLEFSPYKEVKKMYCVNGGIYFLFPDEVIFYNLSDKNTTEILKGEFDGFKVFDSLIIAWKGNCIIFKNLLKTNICFNFKIIDLILFKDSLFILASDSIYRIPFEEIHK